MTPHTSGAADLPDATATLIERLEDAVYEWGNYVDADHAPCPLTRHVDPHIKAIRAELERLHGLAAGQAVAPAEPTREFLERTLAAMEGVIDVADRKTAEFDALRSCVIDLTLMLFKPTTRPAPPAIDDPGPFLDDEGRAMVGTSHHYTADNIRALVAEYKALESGTPEAVERYSNSDHRTRAGVLWRVISALADEVPFAPAMEGGEDAARYQLLRRGQHWSVIDGVGNDLRGEALDAAVDSVRTKKGGTK